MNLGDWLFSSPQCLARWSPENSENYPEHAHIIGQSGIREYVVRLWTKQTEFIERRLLIFSNEIKLNERKTYTPLIHR